MNQEINSNLLFLQGTNDLSLVHVVANYYIRKGFIVKVLQNCIWLCSDQIMISLTNLFSNVLVDYQEYYFKVFLTQGLIAEENFEMDKFMFEILGELYPRPCKITKMAFTYDYQSHDPSYFKYTSHAHINYFLDFLKGCDNVNKTFIVTWAERLKNWETCIDSFSLELTQEGLEFFELAKANLEKQPIKDYLFFLNIDVCVKLTKHQYLKILKANFYDYNLVKNSWLEFYKGNYTYELKSPYDFWNFNLWWQFPQIFAELELYSHEQIQFSHEQIQFSSIYSNRILKHYFIKLFVKYYTSLSISFFLSLKIDLNSLPKLKSSNEEIETYAKALIKFDNDPEFISWHIVENFLLDISAIYHYDKLKK